MTPTDPASTLSVAVPLLITVGYGLTCWFWPFKTCCRCGGFGKLRAPFGRALRHCPHCKHTGLRLRAGRKAYNALHRIHRDLHRTNHRH